MSRDSQFPGAMKSACCALRFAATALVLSLGTQSALALCLVTPGYKEKIVNMAIGRVVIPNDLPVGALIIPEKDFPLPMTGNDKPWDCKTKLPVGGNVKGVMLQGTELTNFSQPKVFSTDVAGVGIRLSRFFSGGANPESNQYPHDRSTTSDFGEFNAASRFRVELFKTAPVTGNGPLAQGVYTRYFSVDDPLAQSVLTTFLDGIGITIITPSCTVDLGSKNISVDFGKVPQSNFKGKGTTTGDRKFNIKLNCKAGQNAENTVLLRMDATQDPSNEQGVLKITQAGSTTATGVGIQVMNDKSVPVKFGEAAEVGPSMTGSYVLPYTARYFQTGDKVTPGRADGTATFTLDYK